MNSNFFDSASQAIHDIVIGTRFLAYKNTDPQVLARILDRADPLSAALKSSSLIAEDQVSDFHLRLQDIEDNFDGFKYLVAKFNQNMKRGAAKSEQPRELAVASV